jgi:hypothetical protein
VCRYVKAITELCYNTNYNGPPPPPQNTNTTAVAGVALVVGLQTCPSTAQEIAQFNVDTQIISQRTSAASVDPTTNIPIILNIGFPAYTSDLCTTGNPTVSFRSMCV